MELPKNTFKQALAEMRPQIGLWSTLSSNIASEALAHSGYDWVVIDMEHSPNEIPDVYAQLQSYDPSPTAAVVRLPWNDPVVVKRVLDIGAFSLLFPMIQTAEEAQAAVASTRYPPRGIRGVSLNQRGNRYGRIASYVKEFERELCITVQIETTAALGRVEEIAAVDGVDGIFFGPADLSADMGYLGQPGHPEVKEALAEGLAKCRKAGKPAGILTAVEADSIHWLREGYVFVAVGTDTAILARGADALLARIKEGTA
ncbi:MAG: HpcH/HpaI aldolase/citrate lyase family protein [Rhodospirillales bacterium]|nr:MAG: HpcH/HpaI aldolase/citrate lyase family protein [Rhodospirillales bacterium]